MRAAHSRPATLVVSYLLSLFAAMVVSMVLPMALRAQAAPAATALRSDQRRVSVTAVNAAAPTSTASGLNPDSKG